MQILPLNGTNFVNLDPGNPSAIYTALMFATRECRRQNQKSCFVTFDQSLYRKGVEIVALHGMDGKLREVVIRLGEFHLMMESVGNIIARSGIEEL